MNRLLAAAREIGLTILVVGSVYLGFSTIAVANYYIPSESMVPTLRVGDRIVVTKWSYGYSRFSLPLDLGFNLPEDDGRIFEGVPDRGDIVVFKHPVHGDDMIKRVIGLPGDKVELREGRLYINDRLVERAFVRDLLYVDDHGAKLTAHEYRETLPGGTTHVIYEWSDKSRADNYGPAIVPAGHLFMMGDNRDNSADSRSAMGFVPLENLVGHAQAVSYSFFACADAPGTVCEGGDWFTSLD